VRRDLSGVAAIVARVLAVRLRWTKEFGPYGLRRIDD
jgi:hypothetical protein